MLMVLLFEKLRLKIRIGVVVIIVVIVMMRQFFSLVSVLCCSFKATNIVYHVVLTYSVFSLIGVGLLTWKRVVYRVAAMSTKR